MEVEKSCEEKSVTNHCVFKKSDIDYIYLKVSMNNSSEIEAERDPVCLKNYLLKCMTNNFGEVNRLVPVDILKYEQATNEVIIRCNSMIFQRLTSSILLNDSKQNYFRIQKVSSINPLGLIFNSRGYSHCSKKNKKRKRNMN